MRKKKNLYRKKIQTIIDILGKLVNSTNISREELIEIVKKTYSERNIEPFRGRAYPPDIFDKELASLYVIGKYGLGLDEDYPDVFQHVFRKEIVFDKVISYLLKGDYETARRILQEISGRIDSNTLARMFRIAFTKTILGFDSEENFFKILHKSREAFPEEERTVRNYIRYYIAYKTAEAIAQGAIRDRLSKELLKHALLARLGMEKLLPSDEYIREICLNVFKIPQDIVDKILSTSKKG